MADREGPKLTIIIAILIVLTTYILIKISKKLDGSERKCNNNTPLHTTSITTYEKKYEDYNNNNDNGNNVNYKEKTIKDLHVKTAYNCCAISDRWVDLCALEYTINERCRCLDFAIFDYDGFPVVGTTTTPNGLTMDSYNYINFDKVMKNVMKKGFVDNVSDPLFINLRIKSASLDIYDLIASILDKYIIGSKLLSINYTYYTYYNENEDLNLDHLTMDVLKGKVVIMVSDCNLSTFKESVLREHTNILGGVVNATNFGSCNALDPDTITADGYDLIQLNNGHIMNGKLNITKISNNLNNNILISIPDDINYNPNYCYYKKAGVNFIGMSFQHKMKPSKKTLKKNLEADKDNDFYSDLLEYETLGNLNNYNKWFNYNNTSFIIKDVDEHTIDTTGCHKTDFSTDSGSIYENDLLLDFDNEETEKKRTYWYQSITKSLSKPLSKLI